MLNEHGGTRESTQVEQGGHLDQNQVPGVQHARLRKHSLKESKVTPVQPHSPKHKYCNTQTFYKTSLTKATNLMYAPVCFGMYCCLLL